MAANNHNRAGWYQKNIFPGQSETVRWREFYFRTFDLSYLLLLLLGWGAAFVSFLKFIRWRFRRKKSSLLLASAGARWMGILGWWSLLAALPLLVFYLRTPVISSRYMMDFGPAFAAGVVAAWWFFGDLLPAFLVALVSFSCLLFLVHPPSPLRQIHLFRTPKCYVCPICGSA